MPESPDPGSPVSESLGSSAPSIRIRRAEPTDAPAMCAVNDRAIRISAAPHYTAEQVQAWAGAVTVELRARTVQDTIAFVAVVDDDVVGFANLIVGDAELDLLYVDPAFGGQGAARALVGAVEEAAVEHQIGEVHTRASLRAEPVFLRLGYRVVQREEHPANGQMFARAHMAKLLG